MDLPKKNRKYVQKKDAQLRGEDLRANDGIMGRLMGYDRQTKEDTGMKCEGVPIDGKIRSEFIMTVSPQEMVEFERKKKNASGMHVEF
jgi:hypothetical protein